ncbi:hypothetical protein OUZ56_009396 [Daphnia magna]|uniref:Uncharacterized protein n=1 Tax=Daphnia magna TaxID=35525 RepID=A0ABR0AFU8_9CRUS|nr:hypothetical protein OUZ56_009396 [Daphnia magna]
MSNSPIGSKIGRWGLPDTRETVPNKAKYCKSVYYPIHDPSNHTDKNIQSVYYSVRPNMVTYKAILILCTGIEGLPETR